MFETDFLSPYDVDESKIVKIPLHEFFINVGFDVGILVVSFIIWKYILWMPIQKMTIPNPATGSKYLIGKDASAIKVIKIVKGILKQMIGKGDILIKDYGFEYFTYIMFVRRLCLIMSILLITDLCIWIPYYLFFLPLSEFSLITMPSAGNNDFRAFYTIWVAVIMLYGMYDLKVYLFTMFMHRTFKTKNKVLNNLMTKTLHMEFLDNHFDNTASIKAQMQQYLVEDMQQQDRVLAVQAIPMQSQLLEYQYRHQITKIISNYGVRNLGWIWKFFKQETDESIQKQKKQNLQKMKKLRQQQISRQHYIRSCMIIVSRIQTAEKLCQQFEIGRALCNFCPDLGYSSGEAMWKVKNSSMIVRWAQNPKDLIWINMGYHKKQLFNFVLFNILCALLLLISFFFIAITSTDTYIKMPTIIGPAILLTFNSTLRFLICKMVEWEKKTLRSQWQIKQFKMTIIYFIINVILGSIVRDTLNLIGILQTGWGWIQLFSLIYKKSDGLFYYILILNQAAVGFFTTLVKPGQIFLDCYQSGLWYDKTTKIKRLAKYGRNDSFRLGYSYSIIVMILSVILIYSVSCPLIHVFGLIFFYTKMYLDTFTITVFHEQEVCSNMRLIERVIQAIAMMTGAWIFLTATSLTFSRNYSNSIILYIFFGLVIYFAATLSKVDSFKDFQTDNIINNQNIQNDIDEWRILYKHPCDIYANMERSRKKSEFMMFNSNNPNRIQQGHGASKFD